MSSGLTPYPAMRDSGVEWLEQVPQHWQFFRAKHILHAVDHRSETGTERRLTVSSKLGVVPRRTVTVTMFEAESYVGHKLCWPDDVVINSLWAWGGGLGVSKYHGLVSTAYGVYRLRNKASVIPDYLHYLLRSNPFQWELQVRSKGIWISRLQLTDISFLGARICLPPLPEQAAIVRYLGSMDRRIQRVIRSHQQQIELLAEQKQAIIDGAVTRGLDPDVPMKDSGVEWLGQVPAHWEVVPNKAVMRVNKEVVGERFTEYTLLSLTKQGIIRRNLEKLEGKFPASFETYQVVEPGDLVFCLFDIDETPRTVGLAALPGMITGAYTRFICSDETLRRYVYWLYLALDEEKSLRPLYSGLRKVITKERFLSAKMSLPPLPEQAAIVRYLEETAADVDTATTQAQREIDLLNEYRTRLIADVVTGKLDVREAARALPEDPDDEIAVAEEPVAEELGV